MKRLRVSYLFVLPILAAAAIVALAPPVWAGSAFTYQGQLQFNGQPVNATCSFEFSLWDAASAGSQQGSTLNRSNVTVTNGLFTVQLDFGATALGSGDRWLETSVGCAGLSGLVTLSRQPLTSAPYAFLADTVAASAVGSSQLQDGAVTSAKILNGTITSSDIASGTITANEVNTTSLQRRVTGNCAAGTAMMYIEEDGTVGCAAAGGFSLPYSGSASDSSPLLSLSNTGSGIGVRGGSDTGRGVLGQSGSSTGVSGLSATGSGVEGVSTSGIGVWGRTAGASAVPPTFLTLPVTPGVYGNGDSTPGVMGLSVSAGGVLGTSVSSSGVAGLATGAGDGVTGMSTAAGIGVRGTSSGGYGVYGETADSNDAHLDDPFNQPRAGVTGVSSAGNGVGVRGIANGGNGYAIVGTSSGDNGRAVYGEAWGDYGRAVHGKASGGHSVGVVGEGTISGVDGISTNGSGVQGYSNTARGVYGVSNKASTTQDAGVVGEGTANDGIGVRGVANVGTNAWAVYGESTSGYAGYFNGNVLVSGTLTKPLGSFKIDHPLDPANKYLSHSFVESPDMKNVYDGLAVLDGAGEAVVELPAWFEALNRDFRYQLTCVGSFAPVYVADEISENHFRIAGGSPGMRVSWQVTGIRQDAFAKAHPIVVEEEKPADEKGFYLHPKELGQPDSLDIGGRKVAAE